MENTLHNFLSVDDAKPSRPGDAAVIKTAGRVFELLEYMREKRRPMTVREVSESLGYPKSSTLVLMKSMATLGYLRYDLRHRAFYATARLATLGDWVLDTIFQGGKLLKLVEAISRATRETAILAVENDIYAQYVHVIMSGHAVQFYVQPGTRRLLAMSGLGWALLSSRSDAEVQRIVEKTNARLAPGGQGVKLNEVLDRVRAARADGYAFSRSTVTRGVGIIALPLPQSDSGERLAVGVGGFVEPLERSCGAIVEAIRSAVASPWHSESGASPGPDPIS